MPTGGPLVPFDGRRIVAALRVLRGQPTTVKPIVKSGSLYRCGVWILNDIDVCKYLIL